MGSTTPSLLQKFWVYNCHDRYIKARVLHCYKYFSCGQDATLQMYRSGLTFVCLTVHILRFKLAFHVMLQFYNCGLKKACISIV